MTSEQLVRRRPALLWVSVGLAAAAIALNVVGPGVVLVAGRPVPKWGTGAVTLAAAIALVIVHEVRRRSGGIAFNERSESAATGVGRLLMVVALLFTVGGAGWMLVAGTKFYVLEPGLDGCRAVVAEAARWPGSRGDIYVARGFGVGRHIGAYFGDDGYGPMQGGTYEMMWGDDGVGSLTVHGTDFDGVWPEGPYPVTCQPGRPGRK